MTALEPELLLRAYSVGVFPMADSRDDRSVYWVEPKRRAILPLDGFRLSRSLTKTIKSDRYRVTRDLEFAGVMRGCADRPETWISHGIEDAYLELHRRGHAHSVECWDAAGALVGGLYGVKLGRAFFGESMFSRGRDASKVALAALVARLRVGCFSLLDCQFITPHLASLGAIEVKRDLYVSLLTAAVTPAFGREASPALAAAPPAFDRLDAMSRETSASSSSSSSAAGSGSTPGKLIVQALGHTS
ncbi:MAG: Leucyl/phenylalanyl-tRNA--protein transferase [uncultured Sphingomonadaceae bacterium]|uniref:Leucyl/phenylalanyl-tRNA--protein transferase n=1 Tax=uncultured Sphingomonadaceae bacterium TaxID=169976 RepID=A0A6J4S5G8_9SPHN|nr:MAG: Leucyl/phenylalanyl-tRNA--protein transferase [uncultured Sphingomonadaceae bacterium]